MSLSEFQILQKLGDGSYSSVYKVKRLEDGLEYALKKVKISHLSDREKENALNEVRILASIKHKNVASYKQAFFDEPSSSLCIVMEYADNGDVFQKICQYQQSNNLFKEKIIWKIFIETVRGLKALHDLKILHRDMKSANIFLYRDYTAKLGDLNVSKVAKKGLLYTQTGTPYYASPEVWKDQPYDCKSDIWSLGCVLYEMCSLVPPFRADDMNGLFKKILKGSYLQIPSNYSMDMRLVIKSLLQVTPAQRPNTEQILDMPIIVRRIKKYFKDETMNNSVMTTNAGGTQYENESELLKTIKFSKNLFKLKLPQPTYDSIQFATLPSTQNTLISGVPKVNSRNMGNLSTSGGDKATSLPKIGVSGPSRNNGISINSHSTKSHNTRINNPAPQGISISGVGEEQNDDDQYEEEKFEYEDQQNGPSQKPYANHEGKQPVHNVYSHQQASSQYSSQKNSITNKTRSYSGRGPVLIKGKVTVSGAELTVNNDYTDANTSYAQNTNRSKSTVSYNEQDTSSQKQLSIKPSQLQPGNIILEGVRGLNISPSQQMLQIQAHHQQLLLESNGPITVKSGTLKKKSNMYQENINVNSNSSHNKQPTPIDEKAELESSQYDEDFQQQQADDNVTSKATIATLKSVKSSVQQQKLKSGKLGGGDSVTTSQQNQDLSSVGQYIIERPKVRDNSQGSINNGTNPNESSVISNHNQNPGNVYRQKLPQVPKNNNNHLSRSPSDQSIEKPSIETGLPRSLQPSTLNKNIGLKQQAIVNQQSNTQAQTISQKDSVQATQKKSPNMDRIVNIYSINSKAKKQKKYYINMVGRIPTRGDQSPQPEINDDIRTKLKQLRDGIGYYEAQKSTVNRNNNNSFIGNENTTYETNPSSRNNNSSVLLPELKGSISPGGGSHHYQSNNSLIGKKASLDRILRGVRNDQASNNQVHRIYRKVFAQQNLGLETRINGVSSTDITSVSSLRHQNNNVPLKVRPSVGGNYNIHTRNNGLQNAPASVVVQNEAGSLLDIQGKSVINNK